ncbi:ornithine carbamoyltransferase/carbamoyltransferase [Streptomyces olivoverticillatus]|uniref:Ornithine carbamoyltransferase/carbamoyltransferase n=1 Tax=Streptomyces olivoverticillatus TaxID=66427 RepID=A0A7W7PKX8_9ACTN|nr:ornithine carbamoyltransferase [Streptomyces olivoverticillatus]MBB4893704.1 ornithine carbamoyltransferase/carbamoyltransferase [Streptomyces olivoverticillatus]
MTEVRQERGLFTLAELAPPQLAGLTARSVELFHDGGAHERPLDGWAVGMLFTQTSTRTRTAFTVGALRLGAAPIAYGPADLQLNTGESVGDTGRVLGSMLDALVARTAGPLDELRELSRHGRLPVVNAMTAQEHPSQGVCDLATLALTFGDLSGIRVLYVGEGNNTAVALAHALATVPGARATFATPAGYGLPDAELQAARQRAESTGAAVEQIHTLEPAPREVDVLYTTRWQTTGTRKPDPGWREDFRPFHVGEELLDRWPRASFMHDLPAHRGDEVAARVLDGPRSLAWTQAAMKLSSAMAVLEWTAAAP